eukprot:UN09453
MSAFGGRNFIFAMRRPTSSNINDFDSDILSDASSTGSILGIGGGYPVTSQKASLNLDSQQSSYRKFYHDEKNDVDMYVSTAQDDAGERLFDKDEFITLVDDTNEALGFISDKSESKVKDTAFGMMAQPPPLATVKESISINKFDHVYKANSDNEKEDNIPSSPLDISSEKVKIPTKIPRGFNERQGNHSCMIFGWNVW